ncbi:MAG: prolipoprotein diacylglyceryl transferase [Spirochaetae bacterium HGW-Spirochaetae-9]|nr:MAG: prolipoprotein diacylglyceryl transferase [Spirochaetae bacterium HGW-Spirochaetae-9]
MAAMLEFPAWLKPEIIPGLPFRWYGLMYVLAFGTAWFLFRMESKRLGKPWSEDLAANFFLWAIVGVLLGGRLAGTLIYEPTDYYWRRPWFIFWPFDETGRFVGYQGMSFHGGLVGVIGATLVWCKVHKERWLAWADIIAMATPLGYTFGRLGNFINGELWGKVTDKPWGMVFPYAERFSAKEAWVQEIAARVGITLNSMNDAVNLPRHPSQLYEAIFEGIVLWLVLWFIVRKRHSFEGLASGVFLVGYGAIRFVIEYFREPDSGLGYVIKLGDPEASTYAFTTLLNFSMGQILCVLMVAGGLIFLMLMKRLEGRRAEEVQKLTSRMSARKLRKKIK